MADRREEIYDQLYALADIMRYDLQPGAHTHAACSRGCGNSARGGGVCWRCALAEMTLLKWELFALEAIGGGADE